MGARLGGRFELKYGPKTGWVNRSPSDACCSVGLARPFELFAESAIVALLLEIVFIVGR